MKLNELLQGIDVHSVTGDLTAEVTGVHYDSRAVGPGSVFVAIRGDRADGNTFIPEALARGAVGVVSENPPPDAPACIRVASDRLALAALSASFHARPTRDLTLVGITGTNGKTTTAHLVDSVLAAGGVPAAMLGTIDYRIPGSRMKSVRTTPEAPDLDGFFRNALEAGCRYAVMEVSSHAIAMRRVEELDFDVVCFTNLTGEHLDYHGTIEAYFQVKKRLFAGLKGEPPARSVLNRDDAHFDELAGCGNARILSFGLGDEADVHPVECAFTGDGIVALVTTPAGKISLKSALLGRLNLYNILAAVGVGLALDLSPEVIAAGVAGLERVPGRFESVESGRGFRIVVDYAHTDDALEQVLDAAREITPGRLIVVFGAGGDRDQAKRARMGEVAGRSADLAIVTSDNPRNENPIGIIGMIEEGLRRANGRYESVPDRRRAIETAIDAAGPGDTIVIAGKGHETVQTVGDQSLPFDDREVVRELLAAR